MTEASTGLAVLTIVFVSGGLLITGLSVPLILGKVPPNGWYGFRTPKTLGDEKVWYRANAYAGRLLLVLGAIWTVAAVVLRFLPGLGTSVDAYGLWFGLISTVGIAALVALSLRYLKSL